MWLCAFVVSVGCGVYLRAEIYRRVTWLGLDDPQFIGFGIDEGTALQFSVQSGRFRVLGQSCVVAISQNSTDQKPSRQRIEFFNPGDEFDTERLRDSEPVPPGSVEFDSLLLGE